MSMGRYSLTDVTLSSREACVANASAAAAIAGERLIPPPQHTSVGIPFLTKINTQ
jgi:hypothetical protein